MPKLNNIEEVKDVVKKMEGWMPEKKAEFLFNEISNNSIDVSVEIGVFGGRGSIAMAAAHSLVGGRHFGIDTWIKDTALEGENSADNDKWWASLDLEQIYRSALGTLFHYELSAHANLLRLDSTLASRLFEKESIGLLHIDGNHSELCSCRDKPEGIIVLDDTNWSTTEKAQRLLEEKCDFIQADTFGDNQWTIYKKRSESCKTEKVTNQEISVQTTPKTSKESLEKPQSQSVQQKPNESSNQNLTTLKSENIDADLS